MQCDAMLKEAFLEFLLEKGILDDAGVLQVLDYTREQTPPIGKLALKEKILTVHQITKILMDQADSGELFGDIGVKLGYLRPEQVTHLLEVQKKCVPGLPAVIGELGLAKAGDVKCCQEEFLESLASIIY